MTDPISQAEQESVCSCGAKIIRVPVQSESCFEYWRSEGTGEVCVEGHWHSPAEPPPAPQAPEPPQLAKLLYRLWQGAWAPYNAKLDGQIVLALQPWVEQLKNGETK